MAWYWIFLIYWLLFFVSSYIVTEFAQNYFYDEVAPYAAARVAAGSMLLAAVLTWWNPDMVDLFTTDLIWTILLGLFAWFVYMLIFQFHPSHAAMVGPIAVVIIASITAMTVDSLANSSRVGRRDTRPNLPTPRKAIGTATPPVTPDAAKTPDANPAPAKAQ